MQAFRTFHNYLHITHETMDHTQGLCDSHASLVLGQSIQSLEYRLDLAVAQQLLCEFLCGTLSLSLGPYLCDSALTKPPLPDLFGRHGKHRK
jgi:hypothetical protein